MGNKKVSNSKRSKIYILVKSGGVHQVRFDKKTQGKVQVVVKDLDENRCSKWE